MNNLSTSKISSSNNFWQTYLKIIIAAVADFWGVIIISVVLGYFEVPIPDEAKSIVGLLVPIVLATLGWIPAMIYTKSKEK